MLVLDAVRGVITPQNESKDCRDYVVRLANLASSKERSFVGTQCYQIYAKDLHLITRHGQVTLTMCEHK